ncbi:MAG: hypothetical protein O3C21_16015, partial [Verrucomicrobia bacterium]|nr:hypothetical protein [Verrucomicrobiota bacterium]
PLFLPTNPPLGLALISAWLVSCAAAFGLGNYFKSGKADQNAAAASGGGTGAFVSVDQAASGSGPQVPGTKKATAENPFAAYVRDGVIPPEDMKTLMKDVMDENDPIKRSELFNKLLASLTPENAKEAYAQLRESRGRGDMEKSQLFLNAWGRIDGAGAMAELMARQAADEGEDGANGGRGGRGGGRGGDAFEMMSILSGWATTDATEATRYLNSNESIEGREKSMLQTGIVQGLLVNGVGDAMDYVANLPTGDNSRDWMMRSIADEVLEGGIDTATSWVNSISDSQLKQGALNTVVGDYMREDMDAAAKWVASMAGESYASDAVRQIAEQMAQSDPQEALAWAGALAAEAQPQAYREALNEWAKTDATAASEYLLSMSQSPERDQAITGLTSTLQREDPSSAILWAQEINDPKLQQETITSAARSWYYSDDKAGASAWLETSGLPAEAVEQVIAEPDPQDFRGGGGFGGGGRRRGGG